MIKYVLAIALTVGLLLLSVPAIDAASERRTERQLEAMTADLETAAVSLFETEEVAHAGAPPPRRTVALALPESSMTTAPVDTLRIERVYDETSIVTYAAEGRSEHRESIAVPIASGVSAANESTTLGDASGDLTVVLRLETDASGEPIVILERI
ncbi:hypothetical protein EL22_03445 [Halostagnicola sp. A56]|uniref:DUF7311 family protein n=1 Tax=Halostagnicola sp. A56 TaxID=1495067 RepID=UPI00049ED62B|nr:hypothetical protein [Halostagnicola sp. A56]KDE58641.1 hypothetical protein EL22_03445 [Halostagnicola sp. A56]